MIRGRKHFTLYPPTDIYWLDQKFYRKAHYERYSSNQSGHEEHSMFDDEELNLRINKSFQIVPEHDRVPWFDHERALTRGEKYLNRLKVSIEPGELLYLPSLWFHQVEQDSPLTIACNFWYDMQYDIKWNYYQFMLNVIKKKRLTTIAT